MDRSTVQPPPVLTSGAAEERMIGRLIVRITYLAVAMLVLGVLGMMAVGTSPLDAVPALNPAGLVAAIAELRPEAVLWLGLMVVIATPIVRVVLVAFAYARGAEWRMVAVSVAILVVIAAGVVIALLTES